MGGSPKNDNHSGHRERMRKRFRETGDLKGFSEHEILEMLLFYVLPRRNTNDLAHELINKFGSLKGVLNASPEELVAVPDMGEGAAHSIAFFDKLMKYCAAQTDDRVDVRDFDGVLRFVDNCFAGEKTEKFKVICIDSGYHIKSVAEVCEGDPRSAPVDFRAMTKAVLNSGCDVIMIAHNHPSAPNTPSQEDVTLTREVIRYMRCLEITVLDHFITGKNGTISMRSCGLIHDMEC